MPPTLLATLRWIKFAKHIHEGSDILLSTNLENQSPTSLSCSDPCISVLNLRAGHTTRSVCMCSTNIVLQFQSCSAFTNSFQLRVLGFYLFSPFTTTCIVYCVYINSGMPRSRITNFSGAVSFPLKMLECHKTQMTKFSWVQGQTAVEIICSGCFFQGLSTPL